MNKFEEEISKVLKKIMEHKYKILEDFIEAYLAEQLINYPDMKIEDIELVEERHGIELKYYFRKRV